MAERATFQVCLLSGEAASISSSPKTTLKRLQSQISGALRSSNTPLELIQQDVDPGVLSLSTRAEEIHGCSVLVICQDHPEWCRQKCFRKQSPELDWDVESETTEWLMLFPEGRFTYLRRTRFWDEGAHAAVCAEELRGEGSWHCTLQGSDPEEVVVLDGLSVFHRMSSKGECSATRRRMNMAFAKPQLLSYEISSLDCAEECWTARLPV
ncbi:unnamed protein product [Effrenium voratum]|nr:unnamed protein product [Effrenium voratum]